jgi:hypothetical protein
MKDQNENSLPPNLRPPAELSNNQLEQLRKSGEWNQGHFAEYQARHFHRSHCIETAILIVSLVAAIATVVLLFR